MENLEKLLNVQTKVMLVTPEIAKKWLTDNTMNRKINERIIKFYADQMAKDYWTLSPDSITFSDTHKLLNGQHRLRAVILSNKSVYMTVMFNMPEEYFKNIDLHRKRTNRDVLSIYGVKQSTLVSAGISKYFSLVNNLSSRLSGNGYALYAPAINKESITDVVNTYFSMPEYFNETALEADRYYSKFKYFGQSDYFAYIVYLTKERKHPEKTVSAFFTQLSNGGTYITNQTIQILRDKLTENAVSKIKMTGMYRDTIIAKTWNAFVSGREMQRLFFNPAKDQKPILL